MFQKRKFPSHIDTQKHVLFDFNDSSSTERKAVASTAKKVSLDVPPDNEIEPGEREPLGIYITKLPLRSSGRFLC